MDSNSWHGVHVWLGDVLDDDWNIVVPGSDTLIVRSRQESTVVVHKGDGVDRTKMLIILLGDLVRIGIVLNG